MESKILPESLMNQIFNIRQRNQLSDSILNYFTMSIGFFFYGCLYADIIYNQETLSLFYEFIIIAGIIQIVLGIYDWYKGKSLTLSNAGYKVLSKYPSPMTASIAFFIFSFFSNFVVQSFSIYVSTMSL